MTGKKSTANSLSVVINFQQIQCRYRKINPEIRGRSQAVHVAADFLFYLLISHFE